MGRIAKALGLQKTVVAPKVIKEVKEVKESKVCTNCSDSRMTCSVCLTGKVQG